MSVSGSGSDSNVTRAVSSARSCASMPAVVSCRSPAVAPVQDQSAMVEDITAPQGRSCGVCADAG
ncbi:hypothetical protein ACWGJT_04395 [Streptomyces xantholiticus]